MSVFDFINGANALTPYTGAALAPEGATVTAPTPGAGPSVPVPATAPGATGKPMGLMSRIINAIAPDANSLAAAAWKYGIFGAKAGQAAEQRAQNGEALKALLTQAQIKKDNAEAAKADKDPGYQIAGNNIVTTGADGKPQFMTPPPAPTETERLVDKWHDAMAAGDVKTAALLERAIKGYQYTPQVIQEQAAAKTGTGVAVANARAAATAKYRAPAKAAAGPKLPTGFILNP